MANYYEQIDKALKKQIEEALLSIDAQEKAALKQLEMNKSTAYSDLNASLSGAYTSYAHALNPYGINNESLFAGGLGASGKSESARANYYNAYTSLVGSLKNTYASTINEIDGQAANTKAEFNALRTDANTEAYNKLLQEYIRREEAEAEKERFEYEKQMDEKEYNLNLEKLKHQIEMDEKDYSLAQSKVYYKGSGSSDSGSDSSEVQYADYLDFPGNGILTDEQFERLRKVFMWLNYSIYPNEYSPSTRIRKEKNKYLRMFADRLTDKQAQILIYM